MQLNSISIEFTDNPDYLVIRAPNCVGMVLAADFAAQFRFHIERNWKRFPIMGFIPRRTRYDVAIKLPVGFARDEYRWNGLTARKVRKLQKRLQLRSDRNGPSALTRGDKGVRNIMIMMGAAAVGLAAFLWAPPTEQSEQEEIWKIDQTDRPTISEVGMSNIALVAREAGIYVDNSKGYEGPVTPFFVFSHPNCDSCNAIDSVLEDVDPQFAPVILPAGFAHNPESMVGIAAAYCSTDPARTWMRMAHTDDIPALPPEDTCQWQEKSMATSLVADLLGQVKDPSDWPMIITPNGKVTTGGYYPGQELRMLNEHLEYNKK